MLACIALFLLGMLPALAAAESPLRVGVEANTPPFSYRSEDGKPLGFNIDIALALCRQMKRDVDLRELPFEDLLGGIKSGQLDMVVASLSQTPERMAVMDFSSYYYQSRPIIIGREGLFVPEISAKSLKDLRIGAQRGTVYAELVNTWPVKKESLAFPASAPECYNDLVEGRIDLLVVETLFGLYFLKTEKGRHFDFASPPLDVADDTHCRYYIAFRKNDSQMAQEVNAALMSIRASGEYDRINRRYFPFKIY